MGMFWLNPHKYVARDANNRELFKKRGVDREIETWQEDLELLKDVRVDLQARIASRAREHERRPALNHSTDWRATRGLEMQRLDLGPTLEFLR